MKDLSDPDAPLQVAQAKHQVTGAYRAQVPLTIGGRDGQQRHTWDGLIDDVRLSNAALTAEQLLINGADVNGTTVGFWRFEDEPGFYQDASSQENDISPGGEVPRRGEAREAALVDLCHALLNSNEFLYQD